VTISPGFSEPFAHGRDRAAHGRFGERVGVLVPSPLSSSSALTTPPSRRDEHLEHGELLPVSAT
jgi:hypothetical protein